MHSGTGSDLSAAAVCRSSEPKAAISSSSTASGPSRRGREARRLRRALRDQGMGRSTWTVLFDILYSTSILSNKLSMTQAFWRHNESVAGPDHAAGDPVTRWPVTRWPVTRWPGRTERQSPRGACGSRPRPGPPGGNRPCRPRCATARSGRGRTRRWHPPAFPCAIWSMISAGTSGHRGSL